MLAQRYTLTVLGSTSFTAVPDEDQAVGSLWSARIDRAGRGFSFSAEIEDSDDDFSAGSGFIRRTGDTQAQSSVRYNWYGERNGLVERWGPSLELHGYWDHDAFWNAQGAEEASAQLGGSVSLRGNVTVFANLKLTSFSFQPEGYENFFVVTEGLKAGERVIVEGQLKARPGLPVKPMDQAVSSEPDATGERKE